MSPLFASLRLPEIFWEAEGVGLPAPHRTPLLVGGCGPHGTIVAASPDARACGVVVGMSTRAAIALCPQGRLAPGRVDLLLDVVAAVRTILAQRIAGVAWRTITDGLVLVSDRSPGDLQAAMDDARRAVREELGVSLACGIASTRLAADIAARLIAPSGLLHVLPGYETRMLASVSLRWLDGVDPASRERWEAGGCHTIGDLAALAPERALRLGGGTGLVLSRLAHGDDSRGLPEAAPADRLTTVVASLADGTGSSARIAGLTMRTLVTGAAARLVAHPGRDGRGVTGVCVRGVPPAPGRSDVRVVRPAAAAAWHSPADVEAALGLALEEAWQPAPVTFVSIVLERREPSGERHARMQRHPQPFRPPRGATGWHVRRRSA